MKQVNSFIVHIYQHTLSGDESPQQSEIIGVVEGVDSEAKTPFSSPQQLWKILAEQYPASDFSIVRHSQGKL